MFRASHASRVHFCLYALTANLKTRLKSWCRARDSNSLQSSQFEKFKRDKSRIPGYQQPKLRKLLNIRLICINNERGRKCKYYSQYTAEHLTLSSSSKPNRASSISMNSPQQEKGWVSLVCPSLCRSRFRDF